MQNSVPDCQNTPFHLPYILQYIGISANFMQVFFENIAQHKEQIAHEIYTVNLQKYSL